MTSSKWQMAEPALSLLKCGKWQVAGIQFFIFCFLLVIFLAACGGSGGEETSDLAAKLTREAVPAELAVVATAVEEAQPVQPQPEEEQPQLEPTDQQPTSTVQQAEENSEPATPTPNLELEAAFAAATETALNVEMTRVSAEMTRVFDELAAEEALGPIRSELAVLGIDPNQGELGFTHPPISLQVNDPDESDFANRNALTVVQDFVMAADITWEPASDESGCGFVVRSDGDDEAPNHYIISLNQSGDGHILFAEQVDGEVDLSDTTDIAAADDPLFNNQSGGTNRLLVIGRGQEFTIYSNGTRLRTVHGKAGFDEGFVAFVAINKSGGIRCDFNNAWLWKLN